MGRGLVLGIAGLAATGLVAGGVWLAVADDGAQRSGTCGGASYALTLEPEDGDRVEVEFELQASRTGEEWQVSLLRDEAVLVEGPQLTDDDAEIEVGAYAVDDGALFRVDFAPGDGSESCSTEIRSG